MDREQRLLPQRTLRAIGAWCFLDHYGPDVVSRGLGASSKAGLNMLTAKLAAEPADSGALLSHDGAVLNAAQTS